MELNLIKKHNYIYTGINNIRNNGANLFLPGTRL